MESPAAHRLANLAPGLRTPAAVNWFVDRKFASLQFLLVAMSFMFGVSPGGFDYAAYTDTDADPNVVHPDPWFRIQWSSLFALALIIIWNRRHLALRLLPGINPMLVVFYLWCATTALWAPEPMKTFTQTVSMMWVTAIAFTSTLSAWQPGTLAKTLRSVVTLILFISAVLAILDPKIGVEDGVQFELQGSWRGMTLTKNVLGQVGAVAVILWIHAWAARDTKPLVAILGLALSIFVLLKSRSSTSMFLSILCGSVMAFMLRSPIRLEGKRALVWLSVALTAFAPIFVYLVLVGSFAYDDIATPIGNAVGKDATFSGRTLIWAEVWDLIQNHRWLGVGFMGFWNGPDSLAGEILRHLQWPVPHSHEGYLDIWNELGLIGLLLFFGFVAYHVWQIFQLDASNRKLFVLHLVIVPYLLLANLTETGWFRPVSVTLLMSVYSSMTINRLLLEQRLARARANAGGRTVAYEAPEPGPAALVPWGT